MLALARNDIVDRIVWVSENKKYDTNLSIYLWYKKLGYNGIDFKLISEIVCNQTALMYVFEILGILDSISIIFQWDIM